jgi:formate dehydrogenase
VTGRLDVPGGNLKSDGFYPNARSGAGVPERGYVDTEFGRLRRGVLPGTLMSNAILDSDEPIRAMIVMSGNPLLSIAGQDRLRKAFEQLELLIVIDIYPSATAELAHVVLPATDMYEREDINIVNIGTSAQPFIQYTPPVVAPQHERRPEWWIAHRLLQELGLPSILDGDAPDPWAKWAHMMHKGSGVALDDLRRGDPVRTLAAPEPGRFFDEQVWTSDGRVDCCPPMFAEALVRCGELFTETLAEITETEDQLRLVHRRDAWMHNTWFANVERMKRAGRTYNPLFMHSEDARRRGLDDGSPVVVSNDNGEIEAVVRFDDDLMAGVVAMVHGWGHRLSPQLRVAHAHPGSNPNVLLPVGTDSFEPLSSQAHMTGIPVDVRAMAKAQN